VTRAGSAQRRNRFIALAAVGLGIVAVAVALLAGGGGDNGDGVKVAGERGQGNSNDGSDRSPPADESTTEPTSTTSEPESTTAEQADTAGAPAPAPASDDGASLNDQGFALIGEGDYAGAVPILEQAVDALRGSGDETTYNYALYNLATAYMGADRPADAIPLLQERMQFDDGQLAEVQHTLDEAYKATGQKPPKEEKAPKPEKPGKGPKPIPPGHEDE
jgi:tetratricopeptide (TPR) repeat protein